MDNARSLQGSMLLFSEIIPQTEQKRNQNRKNEKKKRPSFHFLFSSGLFTPLRDIFLLFLASLLTPTAAFVMSPLCCLEKWPP